MAVDSLRWTSAPVLSSWMLTAHCTWFCGMPAEAESMLVPSIRAGESRYLLFCASQVTSGMVGSSSTGVAGGQVNAL